MTLNVSRCDIICRKSKP